MDVLQLAHAGSVRALVRLVRGYPRPVVIADGAEEAAVVLSPAAFEAILLGGGEGPFPSPRGGAADPLRVLDAGAG